MQEKTTNMKEQTIELPLEPGSTVELFTNIDRIGEGGFMASTTYEATVERYVPETGLLEMSDGTGRIELLKLIEEADGYQVISDGE